MSAGDLLDLLLEARLEFSSPFVVNGDGRVSHIAFISTRGYQMPGVSSTSPSVLPSFFLDCFSLRAFEIFNESIVSFRLPIMV